MDYEEKQLGLEALNVSATLTDNHVDVNVVLGVDDSNSQLITTGQTSAPLSIGKCDWEYEIEYILSGATPTGFSV